MIAGRGWNGTSNKVFQSQPLLLSALNSLGQTRTWSWWRSICHILLLIALHLPISWAWLWHWDCTFLGISYTDSLVVWQLFPSDDTPSDNQKSNKKQITTTKKKKHTTTKPPLQWSMTKIQRFLVSDFLVMQCNHGCKWIFPLLSLTWPLVGLGCSV